MILDSKQQILIVHVATLFVKLMKIYLYCKAQITTLITNKVFFIIVLAKYSDFATIFY